MEKIYTKEELKRILRTLLIEIHSDGMAGVSFPCRRDVIWKVTVGKYSSGILKIMFHSLRIMKLSRESYLLTGKYSVQEQAVPEYEVVLIIADGKIVYMQDVILEKGRMHKIVTVDKTVYLMKENEIIYIESRHNHVVWHCINRDIVSNNSLKKIQEHLSEECVRIHRCYIVNRRHVKKVCRCEARMSNGDIIPIPYKKYVAIRERLI